MVIHCKEMAIRDAFGDEATGDLRLLESGLGGATGVGPDRITYWRRAVVDVLTTPRVAVRLNQILEEVEALYRDHEASTAYE